MSSKDVFCGEIVICGILRETDFVLQELAAISYLTQVWSSSSRILSVNQSNRFSYHEYNVSLILERVIRQSCHAIMEGKFTHYLA
jgi:hypothetical protein